MKSMFIRAGSLVMAGVVFFFAFLALIPVNVNAAPVEYTVCGVWTFNDTIGSIDSYSGEILSASFSCNGRSFSGISFSSAIGSGFSAYFHDSSGFYRFYHYYPTTDGPYIVWDFDTKSIDFGKSDQVVSEEFYTWLTANATFQDTPPAPGPLVEVIQDLKKQNLLTQVLAGVIQVIPVILVCLVGLIEFRKAYQALLNLLAQR